MLRRPARGECADYYFVYIDRINHDDVLAALESEMGTTQALLASVPADAETTRYEADKWTIREVVGHLIDAERVFSNRAFAFARGDAQPIPGMDQNEYNEVSNAGERGLPDLAAEFQTVRDATLALYRGLPDEAWTRTGTASGFQFLVLSFPYITLGHELHHRLMLDEKYLPAIGREAPA